MANESVLYYIGFEESVGSEALASGIAANEDNGCEVYKSIHVYSCKDDSECMTFPFYFLMGQNDYLWNVAGDKILLSACIGFFELGAEMLPDKYSKWTPLIIIADVSEKQVVKIYEGRGRLCWDDNETDIRDKKGLKEYSYDEWLSRYEAQKEKVERMRAELEDVGYTYRYEDEDDSLFDNPHNNAALNDNKPSAQDGSENGGQKKSVFLGVLFFIVAAVAIVLVRWIRHKIMSL
jgi:hypothetical protein